MAEKNGVKNKKVKRQSSKKEQSKLKKFLKVFSFIILFLILTVGVTAAGYAIAIIRSTPPIDVEKVQNLSQSATLYNNQDGKIDSIESTEQRIKLSSDKIPKQLKDAFVSIEDERFYEHQGIDIKRIGGALIHDIKRIFTKKGGLHGASTLTQQLLKNTILTNEKTKVERKIKEIYLALQLEKKLSKDDIVTAYLNTIPLGGTVYGVEAASLRYFDKGASELNLIESAYMAGVTQAPGYYDAFIPANQKDPTKYINRTKTVLNKMFELGKITQEEKDQAFADLDNDKLVFHYRAPSSKLNYESFSRAVLDQVQNDLQEKLKYSEEEARRLINQGGLQIYTTMDEELQKEVQSIVDNRKNLSLPGTDEVNEYGIPKLQAAAVIKDPKTGEIKAMVGGRGDQPALSLNRAYDVLKPTGSTSKPLSVYAPAIDLKLMTSGSVIDDAPFTSDELRRFGGHQVNNMGGGFKGYLPLTKALSVSSNVVASKIVDKIGNKNALAYGERFGLKYNETSANSQSALALGEFDNSPSNPDGANPYILASAYGAFANNGVIVESMLYREVKDSSGKTILKAEPKKTQVISPETAYIIYDMMKSNSASQGSAKVANIPTAGKTGTSSQNKNYWFSGLTPHYSASVWIGYDQPKAMSSNSTTVAGGLFGKIMNVAHKGLDGTDIPMPKGVTRVSLCADSGLIPTKLCSADPRGSRIQSYLVISGTEPKEYCSTHVSAQVNSMNGRLANNNTPASLKVNRVFIKKKNPNSATADYKYVLPSAQDNMTTVPIDPSEGTTTNPEENPENPNGETVPPINDGTPSPPEGNIPPANGGSTQPSQGNTPPANSGSTPPSQGNTPPTNGGSTSPSGGNTSPINNALVA